jgi:hypothetical protein
MTSTEIGSPGVFHFLRLPLELRESIYRMLLTTTYCTYPKVTGIRPSLGFNLQTAILLVNKQILVEATRILYHGNDFIILKVDTDIDMIFTCVPTFQLLSEDRVTSPVLRIELAVVDGSSVRATRQQTIITTSEGLQSIINASWVLGYYYHGHRSRPDHGDLRLTLNFTLKAKARYEDLSDLLLKPWDKVHGFKELVLTGDIKEPMCKRLEKYILEWPSPSEVTTCLTKYHSLAERKFEQEDYTAAQWWWTMFDEYWTSLSELATSGTGGLLFHDVFRDLEPMYSEGRLKLVIAYLRQLNDVDIVRHADEISTLQTFDHGWSTLFGSELFPTRETKSHMVRCLERIPLEKSWSGRKPVRRMVRYIRRALTRG